MRDNKKPIILNKNEVKVFIMRTFGKQTVFCRQYDINIESFRGWLSGDRPMYNIESKVIEAVKEHNYPLEVIVNPSEYVKYEAKTA